MAKASGKPTNPKDGLPPVTGQRLERAKIYEQLQKELRERNGKDG